MKVRKTYPYSVALMASIAFLASGCGATPASSQSNSTTAKSSSSQSGEANHPPHIGGQITLDAIQQVKDLDPAKADDTQSMEVVNQLYDQLVTFNKQGTNVVPMLAKSWKISSDGLTYTFNLRSDAKFWNGDPVTAQSFVDELKRILTKSIGCSHISYFYAIQGAQAFSDGKSTTISGVSTPDKYTLVLKLNQPEKFFIQLLAMPFLSAVDQSYINKVGNDAFDSTKPMGSGPFELSEMGENNVVLTKNPNYWRTDANGNHLPYLDKVTFQVTSDAQVDAMHFEVGQTAFLGWNTNGIPTTAFPTFQAKPNLQKLMLHQPELGTQYLGMNLQIAPFNNTKVRQAIEYAIDKQQIINIENGRGLIANQPMPPNANGYVKKLPSDATYTYNPAKAKELLKEAGYPNGFTTTLYSSNDSDQMRIDVAVQNMLAKVGIQVKLAASTWSVFLSKNESGKTGLFWLAWVESFPDPSDFLYALFDSKQEPFDNSTVRVSCSGVNSTVRS